MKLSPFPDCTNNAPMPRPVDRITKALGLTRSLQHSLQLRQGWRKPPAPGRMEADGRDRESSRRAGVGTQSSSLLFPQPR